MTARSSSRQSRCRSSPAKPATALLARSVEPTRLFPLGLDAGVVDDSGDGDHVVSTHDERPVLTLRPGDLGVDEHVLDLLRSAGEPVAGPPASYLKPCEIRADAPRPPMHLAVEIERAVLEPEPVVFAHGLHAAAEVDALRPGRRGEQLGERRRQRLTQVERAEDVRVGGRVEPAEQRQDLVPDKPALRSGVARVDAERQAFCFAVAGRLRTPDFSSGRTTPSARRASIPVALPRELSR